MRINELLVETSSIINALPSSDADIGRLLHKKLNLPHNADVTKIPPLYPVDTSFFNNKTYIIKGNERNGNTPYFIRPWSNKKFIFRAVDGNSLGDVQTNNPYLYANDFIYDHGAHSIWEISKNGNPLEEPPLNFKSSWDNVKSIKILDNHKFFKIALGKLKRVVYKNYRNTQFFEQIKDDLHEVETGQTTVSSVARTINSIYYDIIQDFILSDRFKDTPNSMNVVILKEVINKFIHTVIDFLDKHYYK